MRTRLNKKIKPYFSHFTIDIITVRNAEEKTKHKSYGWVIKLKNSHLCRITGPLEVARHKEVDDGSTDALSGQDEGQGPPKTQHLFDGGIALQGPRQTRVRKDMLNSCFTVTKIQQIPLSLCFRQL